MSSSSSSVPPLPAELILHILELAYPPHAEDDYIGRSSDVLQCCLVSKQWKELAEPALWRSITITRREQVDQLAQQPSEQRNLTRNLAFQLPSDPQEVAPKEIRQALRLFPKVEHVRMNGEYDKNELDDRYVLFSDFAVLSSLQSLGTTSYVELDNAMLPRLEVFRTPYFGEEVDVPMHLNSNNTPALRHLAVDYLEPSSQPGRLTDLLESVEVDVRSTGENDVVLQHRFRQVLFEAFSKNLIRHQSHDSFGSAVPYPPCHIKLRDSPISWVALDNIFLLLHRPSSLFLPLLPSSASTRDGADDSGREAFLKRCKDEGVEVRWYRPAKEKWREVGCREFREYVEEPRAREAAERS
ncbi:hypothetical protein JCM8097_005679 [Rhodosporidiobolus ruineniae]